MSSQSAEICIVKAFNVHLIHFLTVRKHLLPLGKALNVKCRSLGKYQLLIPLAKALVKAGHIAIEGSDINYRNLQRTEVNVITDIESLIGDGEESQDSCSLNDVVNDSQVRYLICVLFFLTIPLGQTLT